MNTNVNRAAASAQPEFHYLKCFEFQLQECLKFSILIACTSSVEVSKVSVHLIDRLQRLLPKIYMCFHLCFHKVTLKHPDCKLRLLHDTVLILTSLCFHTCCKTPCGCTLESSRWSKSLCRPLAAQGRGHWLESAVSGSAGPQQMTRRYWWGWSRWSCSPPGQ